MERVIVPKGTKQNFETVFSVLQNYTITNLKRRLDRFVATYGIEATVKNGAVTSSEFQVAQASPTTLTIEPGTAVTNSSNFLRALSQTTVNLGTVSSGLYTVFANANPYTNAAVPVVNGFLYDSGGGTTTDTRQHAGISFDVVASGTEVTTSGVYLANIDWNGTDTCTVYDRRIENVFLLKDSAINDSNIVKKDRDSSITADISQTGELSLQFSDSADSFTWKNETGTVLGRFLKTKNYLTQDTGFGGETDPSHPVDVDGIAAADEMRSDKFTSDSNDDILIQPKATGGKIVTKLYDDTGVGQWQDKDGTIVVYWDKDGVSFNKPVTHSDLLTIASLTATGTVIMPDPEYITMSGVTNTDFKIGVNVLNGGAGVSVLTAAVSPSNPVNFRVYDVKPTENKDEQMAYVHFKWNYEDINGTDQGGGVFKVTGLLGGDTVDEEPADLIGKYLFFPETSSTYAITAWNNTTKNMALEGYSGEEPTVPDFPCRIIDLGTGYTLKLKSNRSPSASIEDFSQSNTNLIELDSAYIYNPQFAVKLPIANAAWIQLRTRNSDTEGSYVLLGSGTYDPDHAPGGQGEESYGSPLVPTLPNLDTAGTLTLTPDTFGFAVDIGGWYDAADADKTAHEFELAYTTLDTLDWADDTRTTLIKTTNRRVPVSTVNADTLQVGVRPYQNKQLVGTAVTGAVVPGGGGMPPNAVMIGTADFNISRLAGSYTTKTGGTYGSSEQDWYLTGITWSGLVPSPGSLDGRSIDFESGGYNNLSIFSNTGELGSTYIWLNPGTVTGDIPAGTENFTIASSKAGRRILKTNLPADFKATYIHVTVNSGRWLSITSPAVLRVWQEGQESSAGSVDITTRNGVVTGNIDVDIKIAQGAGRTLIVDLWDPDDTSPNNDCSVSGTVEVYGEIILSSNRNAALNLAI